jgi:hypothetical protein
LALNVIVRYRPPQTQRGSHRKMQAPNRPTVIFAFHDNQTIRPSTVKDFLCDQVGLAERDALALL